MKNRKAVLVTLIGCLILVVFLTETVMGQGVGNRGPEWQRHVIDVGLSGADGGRLLDADADGDLDLSVGWEESGKTRIYLNPGYSEAVTDPWPYIDVGNASGVEDAVMGDIDGDGRVDVVSARDGGKRVTVHFAPTLGDYTDPSGWTRVSFPAPASGAPAWMYSVLMDVDEDGDLDIIAGGKGNNAVIRWFEAPTDNRRDLSSWPMHDLGGVGWLMSLFSHDMDGDGDLDLMLSDRKIGDADLRGARWLENPGTSGNQSLPWTNRYIYSPDDGSTEVMFLDLADLDGDSLVDVLVPLTNGNRLIWFRRLDTSGLNWTEYLIDFPSGVGQRAKSIRSDDLNNDGQRDLVLSTGEGGVSTSGVIWLEPSNGVFDSTWTEHEISGPDGIKFDDSLLIDLDGDGDLDVINTEEDFGSGSKGLGVIWYENPLEGNGDEEFVLIVLPDTQKYSDNYPEIFQAQTQWIVDNQEALNIVYVAHEGDIVEHPDDENEWIKADDAMSLLDAVMIPYGVVPGNHDEPTTFYNQYFGVDRFCDTYPTDCISFYGDGYPSGSNDNNYTLFTAGGMDFIAINLEYVTPAADVLDWADQLLTFYDDRRAIVVSHYILNTNGNFDSWGQQIYDALNNNSNLFLMLCGHIHAEARRTDGTLHTLLADYQEYPDGGNGFLRIMHFSPKQNEIRVETYSPWLDQYETGLNSQFVLPYDMGGLGGLDTIINFQDGVSPEPGYTGAMDTMLSQNNPGINYGGDLVLSVNGDDPPESDNDLSPLLYWDISAIPAGSIIQAANIMLNVTNGSDNSYQVYEMKRDWVESESTWDLFSSNSGWEIPGALGLQDRGDVVLGTLSHNETGMAINFNSEGVTLVQSWLDDPASNHGLIIANSDATDVADFDSREALTADNRPKLTIRYTAYQSANHPPDPNPAQFALLPTADSDTAINMTASTASDPDGVEYYFDCINEMDGCHDSGWQDSPNYRDTGLSELKTYTYTVTTRDKSLNQNMTDVSEPESETTLEAPNIPPTASAEADPASGTSPLTVNFTGSNSTDSDGTITGYAWDFGDGNTSVQPDPTHIYLNPNTYTAVLTVTDDEGAADADQVTITVNVPVNQAPTATVTQPGNGDVFDIGDALNYAGDGADPEDGILPASAFTWTAVGSEQSYPLNADVKSGAVTIPPYVQPGEYRIVLEVEDSQGVIDTDEITITVGQVTNQPPTAVAEADPASGTSPLTVNFTGSSSTDSDGAISEYLWDFGDGNTSNETDPTHIYENAGSYAAVLTVTDDDGTADTDQVAITVNAQANQTPTATVTQPGNGDIFDIGDTLTYAGDGTDPEDGILPASAFTWTAIGGEQTYPLDADVKSGAVIIPTYVQPGGYRIVLEVEDSQGIIDTDEVTITVTQ